MLKLQLSHSGKLNASTLELQPTGKTTVFLHSKIKIPTANVIYDDSLEASSGTLDLVRNLALLAHPVLACGLLFWIWRQYSWRKMSTSLKGEARKEALAKHEKMGNKLVWATFVVILIAFVGRAIAGWRTNGDLFSEIWPTNLHGFMGPLGFALLLVLAKLGKQTKSARVEGKKFTHLKLKHGRAADFIIIIAIIHAFLGFLYLFSVLG